MSLNTLEHESKFFICTFPLVSTPLTNLYALYFVTSHMEFVGAAHSSATPSLTPNTVKESNPTLKPWKLVHKRIGRVHADECKGEMADS